MYQNHTESYKILHHVTYTVYIHIPCTRVPELPPSHCMQLSLLKPTTTNLRNGRREVAVCSSSMALLRHAPRGEGRLDDPKGPESWLDFGLFGVESLHILLDRLDRLDRVGLVTTVGSTHKVIGGLNTKVNWAWGWKTLSCLSHSAKK